MPKIVIGFKFSYIRDTKKFFVYQIIGEHDFFPKEVYLSKSTLKTPSKELIMKISQEDSK